MLERCNLIILLCFPPAAFSNPSPRLFISLCVSLHTKSHVYNYGIATKWQLEISLNVEKVITFRVHPKYQVFEIVSFVVF